jgi:Protein of unknown function (DUF4038)/Putative collagen-binding domain of a collagenase
VRKYITIIFLLVTCISEAQLQPLKISGNKRYFQTGDGNPFFWLGDTGWLLFKKLTREEAVHYLDVRKQEGFNVVQVMLLHELTVTDAYGDSALTGEDVSRPKITKGNDFKNKEEYDYWDNVDFVIDEAEKRGIYMALVPVWGSNIKKVTVKHVKEYAVFLANRYKNKSNIIWVNGGDTKGNDALDKWNSIGNTIRSIDKKHLITFHPRGRNSSSEWFQNEPWLDFNMFQSGHRTYAQDTSSNETLHYGEDNWRYVNNDYKLKPTKPTLDGEPSYEGIPYGLHDTTLPRWKDKDVRRYAYWSVFAGAAGFTYGDNSVIQMHKPGDKTVAYGAKEYWFQAMNDPGSSQMIWLKKLMLSKSYFNRVPDESLVADQGKRYNYVAATRGEGYAFFYDYTGRNFKVNMGKIQGAKVKATWYNPIKGTKKLIGLFVNKDVHNFDPPGEQEDGNDWILILESKY